VHPPARRPLRLVLYTGSRSRGGAEQSARNLLAHLGEHVHVTVLGVEASVAEWVAAARPGTNIRVVAPVRSKFDPRAIVEHVRAVRALRPDVLQANLPMTYAGQYGILAGLVVPGVRVVVVEQSPIASSSRFQRFHKRLASRRLAAHVSVGERSARMVERAVGLPRDSVRTIYNGVPDEAPPPRSRAVDGPVVGALGRLSHEKGFDVLIRALAAVDDVTAVVVGDGALRAQLQELATELGVDARLEITGWSDEARSYLSTFDIFCLPSRFEGFPLAVVEAMFARLPVVASDVGSVSEAVIDAETGLLVPPDDPQALAAALRKLLGDPEARRRMGARGREVAQERFTASVMARAFETLYDDILTARPI
jgi:glycosyltransferase involved in cell wall biosynthesis